MPYLLTVSDIMSNYQTMFRTFATQELATTFLCNRLFRAMLYVYDQNYTLPPLGFLQICDTDAGGQTVLANPDLTVLTALYTSFVSATGTQPFSWNITAI